MVVISGYLRSRHGKWGPAIVLWDGRLTRNSVYISNTPGGRFFFNVYVNGKPLPETPHTHVFPHGTVTPFTLEHNPETGRARAWIGNMFMGEYDAPRIELRLRDLPSSPWYYSNWWDVPEYQRTVIGAGVGGVGVSVPTYLYTKNVPLAVGAGVVGALIGAAIGYLVPV